METTASPNNRGKEQTKKDPTIRTIIGVEYWTTTRAAKYLGVSKPTLLKLTHKKRINHLPFEGVILFKKEDLNEFFKELTVTGYATKK